MVISLRVCSVQPPQIRPSHSARLGGHFHFFRLALSGKAIIAISRISVMLVFLATAILLSLVRCSFANRKEQRCLLICPMSVLGVCPSGPTKGGTVRYLYIPMQPFS